MALVKYNLNWPDGTDDFVIERQMIRHGGTYLGQGHGLLYHYLQARKILWPKRYTHRWIELIYKEIIENMVTILMGAASTNKTSTASEWCLLDYFCFPENTLVIVSTVTGEKLEQGVWGEIKKLWNAAKEIRPWLAGFLIDHKKMLATDKMEEGRARVLTKGIVGKPCYVGSKFIGIGTMAGTKQERFRFLADELAWMEPSFFNVLPNMFSNPDVKVIGSGNPRHDPDDQLGIAAEPEEGWSGMPEPTKTTVWNTRFHKGRCVNLVGTDSPNFDAPPGTKEPYPGLIGRKFVERIVHTWREDSPEYFTQVLGVMRIGLAVSRVITRQLCREHRAHDTAIWKGTERTRVYALDPAYGGGDRCIGIWGEFGEADDGTTILRISKPHLLRINARLPMSPEDQIANTLAEDLTSHGIDPKHSFYDSTGRGTIGFSFARKFGSNSPIPVDSGGRCTARPVRQDLFVTEPDGEQRLKRCDEHYSKFVTEMWFSVHYAIVANQIRELPEEVMAEGTWREYYRVAGDKIEVEPKDKMRERTGRSPDLFDALAVLVEGARRLGFKIGRLGDATVENTDPYWFEKERDEFYDLHQGHLLVHK